MPEANCMTRLSKGVPFSARTCSVLNFHNGPALSTGRPRTGALTTKTLTHHRTAAKLRVKQALFSHFSLIFNLKNPR